MIRPAHVSSLLARSLRCFRPGRLLALAAGAALLGCADPASPEAIGSEGPRMIKEVDRKLSVLNFTLRAVEDPNIIDDPNISQAFGHLQLKLTRLADGSVRIAFKGQVQNPGGERFTGFSLRASGGGRGSEFIALKEVEGRPADRHIRIDPEDATIPPEIAARLYGTPDTVDDPNLLVVTFFTDRHPAGAIQGTHSVR